MEQGRDAPTQEADHVHLITTAKWYISLVLLIFEVEDAVVGQAKLAADAISARRDIERYGSFRPGGNEAVYLEKKKE